MNQVHQQPTTKLYPSTFYSRERLYRKRRQSERLKFMKHLYRHGYTFEEIGRVYNIPPEVVKQKLIA